MYSEKKKGEICLPFTCGLWRNWVKYCHEAIKLQGYYEHVKGLWACLINRVLAACPYLTVPSCPLAFLRFTYQWLWFWCLWRVGEVGDAGQQLDSKNLSIIWYSHCQGTLGGLENSSSFSFSWLPERWPAVSHQVLLSSPYPLLTSTGVLSVLVGVLSFTEAKRLPIINGIISKFTLHQLFFFFSCSNMCSTLLCILFYLIDYLEISCQYTKGYQIIFNGLMALYLIRSIWSYDDTSFKSFTNNTKIMLYYISICIQNFTELTMCLSVEYNS